MTNINELKDALKETLEEKGVLNEIRARMRSAIFSALDNDDKPKPKISDENLLINETYIILYHLTYILLDLTTIITLNPYSSPKVVSQGRLPLIESLLQKN